MAFKTVNLQVAGFQREYTANAVITPGDLIELMSTDKVRRHATAGGDAQRMFAKEDSLQGKEIGEDYAADDIVFAWTYHRGSEVYALLALNQTIVIGDKLESAGNGKLRKHTASSAGVVEFPESIVAIAKEAVTTTSAFARIVVEIL